MAYKVFRDVGMRIPGDMFVNVGANTAHGGVAMTLSKSLYLALGGPDYITLLVDGPRWAIRANAGAVGARVRKYRVVSITSFARAMKLEPGRYPVTRGEEGLYEVAAKPVLPPGTRLPKERDASQ